jgi:hypothetical protein
VDLVEFQAWFNFRTIVCEICGCGLYCNHAGSLDQCLQLTQLLTYFINLSIITVDCNGYTVCPKIGVQTTYYLIEDV